MSPTFRDLINSRLQSKDRQFDPPVAWLFGRQLLGSIRGILLYALYGKKMDPRDWMQASVFPATDPALAQAEWFGDANPAPSEFWFDYIADSGDGMTATYSIAYLCGSDLYVETRQDDALRKKPVVTLKSGGAHVVPLPRGAFLLVGGDTSYHVSDYITLATRFWLPFKWAHDDLEKAGQPTSARPLFGIPGNHDYYDQLDGFRRQFRRGVRPEQAVLGPGQSPDEAAQLSIPGYVRYQNASYLALRLPFDWSLWGLDTEIGQIDERQQKFFLDLYEAGIDGASRPPQKLIVATCAPTTVIGKFAAPNDEKAYDAIRQLGLSTPFIAATDENRQRRPPGDAQLAAGQCRLDLSGDVHQYARYWGPKIGDGARQHAKAEAPSAASYASVVSGLGGAFHHPTRTYVDEIQEQALYPSEAQSTDVVATKLLGFVNIWKGGFLWLAGGIVAFVITFAANAPQSSREFINNVLIPPALAPNASVIHQVVAVLPGETPETREEVTRLPAPGQTFGVLLLAFAPLPLFFAAFWGGFYGHPERSFTTADTKPTPPPSAPPTTRKLTDPETLAVPEPHIWRATVLATVVMSAALVLLRPYRAGLTPFGNSLATLWTLVWMAATLVLSLRYAVFLFKKAHRTLVRSRDWAIVWVLIIVGIAVGASGLWLFGMNNLPALLTSDIVFVCVVLVTGVGLVFLPFIAGAELLHQQRAPWRHINRAAIGVWHAAMQLVVPFVLVRRGGLLTWTVAILTVGVASEIGVKLIKHNRSKLLVVTWVVYGLFLVALPWLTTLDAILLRPYFLPEHWTGMRALLPSTVALLLGAMTACSMFGWYLAVCFMFNGHNNEVGGAAQIEEFKEFLRICVRKDSLTVYAIAVDKPMKAGAELDPRIVDVFTLRTKT